MGAGLAQPRTAKNDIANSKFLFDEMIQRNVPGIGPFVLPAFAVAIVPVLLAGLRLITAGYGRTEEPGTPTTPSPGGAETDAGRP